MTIPKLYFLPSNPVQITDNQQLLETLVSLQLINKEAHSENHYLPGENFLSQITFLGCSPNINLAPVENENHCFISILEHSSKTRCLGHTNTVNPKCPGCKKRIANWKTENWKNPGQLCLCDKCSTKHLYAELNWKQECGFARCGFEISHIYPHEAVPTDQLLNALEQASGFKWDYCYANN